MDNEKARRWAGIIDDFTQSKLTLNAFCKDRRLSLHQLQYWRKRFKKPHARADAAFIPLKVSSTTPTPAPAPITICHGNFRIELSNAFDPDTVKRLIRCFQ